MILKLCAMEKCFCSSRSSRSQMFFKIGVLKNFANFTGKQLCWSIFLIKLQAFRPTTLLKRDFKGTLMQIWKSPYMFGFK